MDYLNSFIYNVSTDIEILFKTKIKRSYLYECYAAFYNYKSYSAFLSDNIPYKKGDTISVDDSFMHYTEHQFIDAVNFQQFKYFLKNSALDPKNPIEMELRIDFIKNYSFLILEINKIFKKLEKFKEKLSETILSSEDVFQISKFILKQFYATFPCFFNIRFFRELLSLLNYQNGPLVNKDLANLTSDHPNIIPMRFDFIENHFSKLIQLSNSGCFDASGVLSFYNLYLANKIAPYGTKGLTFASKFGGKWDESLQSYIFSSREALDKLEKYESYINTSKVYNELCKMFPISVKDIESDNRTDITHSELIDIKRTQLIFLMNQGDLEAIEVFLYNGFFKNATEAWTYIFLGTQLGTDFTKQDYQAINSYTGEIYDGRGPLELVGRGPLKPIPISENDKVKAKSNATLLFSNILEKGPKFDINELIDIWGMEN